MAGPEKLKSTPKLPSTNRQERFDAIFERGKPTRNARKALEAASDIPPQKAKKDLKADTDSNLNKLGATLGEENLEDVEEGPLPGLDDVLKTVSKMFPDRMNRYDDLPEDPCVWVRTPRFRGNYRIRLFENKYFISTDIQPRAFPISKDLVFDTFDKLIEFLEATVKLNRIEMLRWKRKHQKKTI